MSAAEIKTQDLAQNWLRVCAAYADARARATAAEQEVKRIEAALAASIAPKDIKVGEKIAVWVRVNRYEEHLIEVVAFVDSEAADAPVQLMLRLRDARDTSGRAAGPGAQAAASD